MSRCAQAPFDIDIIYEEIVFHAADNGDDVHRYDRPGRDHVIDLQEAFKRLFAPTGCETFFAVPTFVTKPWSYNGNLLAQADQSNAMRYQFSTMPLEGTLSWSSSKMYSTRRSCA